MSNAFGTDTPAVTYASIVAHIKQMTPRDLPRESLDDVITMIEFMRERALTMHHDTIAREQELNAREAELNARERELALKQRAVDAVLATAPAQPRKYFWR